VKSPITAALYTGEAAVSADGKSSGPRTKVTENSLITDRAIIRDDPPDILLSNYKMLDQLLLRSADQRLWEKSADSLTYLVLDDFHTYDGARAPRSPCCCAASAWRSSHTGRRAQGTQQVPPGWLNRSSANFNQLRSTPILPEGGPAAP